MTTDISRCPSYLCQAIRPLHPSSLDHVHGVRGPPHGHAQLLLQLPHLLLCLQTVQADPLKSLSERVPGPHLLLVGENQVPGGSEGGGGPPHSRPEAVSGLYLCRGEQEG